MEHDTIAAISTGMTPSGIGIVRVSGPKAIEAADRIYRPKDKKKKLADQPSHTVHYGYIEEKGEILDEVLITLFRAPRSFTAEDTVEINCHGGVYALKRVLEAVLDQGVRPADPGEFTKRAFLNGRIDLSRAEAVMDVIQSQNEYALKSSVGQLRGSVYKKIEALRKKIVFQIAKIEASLDDPEHLGLEGYGSVLLPVVKEIKEEIGRLIHSSEDGRIFKEGIRTVILGKPNVGKSSLLNLLAGEERAIVTEIAGTTRDVLEETVSLGGITLQVLDTAGIRDTADKIEKIGVERAKEKARDADLILYVVDGTLPFSREDREILESLQEKRIILLLNKSDLEQKVGEEALKEITHGKYPVFSVSAKENTGMDLLEEEIKHLFFQGELTFNNQVYITNARQKRLLGEAAESLDKVMESIEMDMPEDFYSIDLTGAYESLGKIIGEASGEDVINEIFGSFCMGK